MTDDFLDNRPHLVHLNWINNKVLSLISIFFRSDSKAVGYLFNTVIQNIWETDQHRSCDIPQLKFINQFLQVDGYTVFTRSYHYMTLVINTKV